MNPLTVMLLLTVASSVASAQNPKPQNGVFLENDPCLECHSDKSLTKTNREGKEVSLYVDVAIQKASAHKSLACVSCHSDFTKDHPDNNLPAKPVDCRPCHKDQSATYDASAHGIALKSGDASAPVCVDCHGRHDVLPPTSPESPLHFTNLAKTCGNCHEKESEEVRASVHGQGAAKGERESATCIDCHNGHQIKALKGASPYVISIEVCSQCHTSARLNAKFQIPGSKVSTFLGSYHGLAVQGRSASAANCASCHGFHKVLPSTDPNSSIHKSHLVETCGRCHPGATENFAFARVHSDNDDDLAAIANHWVRTIYLVLIFGVVGALSLHNLMAWLRSAIHARRNRGVLVTRMNRNYRIQHFILLTSFILLALTGFALKYPDTWLAWIFGSETIRHWLHRGAGVVLIGLGLFHLIQCIFTRQGRNLLRDFLPCRQDAKDIATNLRYFIGTAPGHAKFGRFGYPEKLEYWAVVWGSVIMGITGLMIWFKLGATQFLPRWVVEVAATVHYYEAILACLAIIVWHLYLVIFSPDVYPINWAWWDGKVSKKWQQKHHPFDQPESESLVPHQEKKPTPPSHQDDETGSC